MLSTAKEDVQRFREALQGLPLVLMADGGSTGNTGDVWKGIELGAVDFLERPLSLLKLQNIWQHVVRKVRRGLVSMYRQFA